MKRKKDEMKAATLSRLVAQGMQEKKGEDILILDLQHVKQAVADFFVICSGNSNTQVDALMDAVEETVYKYVQENPWHKEGNENKEWILLDYVDVVAHIFRKDRREFYALEELWSDAVVTKVED
ncbi:MAG TPA: ribosome silencing factor [Microscillaceae bacterium]|jgi:ribosome-associated protein|nr:ribosome silencing factor [Microscillaceae bacterium]